VTYEEAADAVGRSYAVVKNRMQELKSILRRLVTPLRVNVT
jgi:hypothetical protein